MDIATLYAYIDKAKSITLDSTMDDFYELRQMYEDLKNSLNDEWKEKRAAFFEKLKRVPIDQWGDGMPGDGFFNPLLKAFHYCNTLCVADSKQDKNLVNIALYVEGKECNIAYLEMNKNVLDQSLDVIKQQYPIQSRC